MASWQAEPRYDLDEVRAALRADTESVTVALLLDKPSSRTPRELRWGGKRGKSGGLSVVTAGPKHGQWFDHVAGAGGDLFDLIERELRCGFPDALAWARNFTGIADPGEPADEAERQRREEVYAAHRARWAEQEAEREADEAADDAQRIAIARRFLAASVPVNGTIAERYLIETRGIPRPATGWPGTVRFHPGRRALILAGTDPDGAVRCVQLVHLTRDGTKAPHTPGRPTKQTRGVTKGAPCKLPGAADGPILLAEGPETGLSLWASTGYETHVLFGGFGNYQPPTGRTVILCRDDDPRWSPADRRMRKAEAELRIAGHRVLVAIPWHARQHDRSDFNDVIKADGPAAVSYRIELALMPPTIKTAMSRAAADVLADETTAKFFVDAFPSREPIYRSPAPPDDDDILTMIMGPPPSSEPPAADPIVRAIRMTVGAGKTRIAIKHTAYVVRAMRAAGDGRALAIAIPTRKLGDELVTRFAALGITAQVWRGREAPIPEHEHLDENDPGRRTMCTEPERVRDAAAAHASIQGAVCRKKPEGGQPIECPHFKTCAYQKQRKPEQRPDVWIVPHENLFRQKPFAIGTVAALIIDESFWQAAVGKADMLTSALVTTPTLVASDTISSDRLAYLRRRASDIIADHPRGSLSREAFRRAGFTASMANEARALELMRLLPAAMMPDTPADKRKKAVREVSAHNGMVLTLRRFWRALMALLADGGPDRSGWAELGVETTRKGDAPVIRLRWRKDISEGWKAPTLLLDADLDMQLVRPFFPQAELAADIRIAAPHQRIIQVVGSNFAKSRFVDPKADDDGDDDGAKDEDSDAPRRGRRLRDLHAQVCSIGRRYAPRTVLVVAQKAVEAALVALRLPPNVQTAHHNAIRGRDEWRDAAAIVVIGRTQPGPVKVEEIAEALDGAAVERLPSNWFNRVLRPRQMASGEWVYAEGDHHPNPIADAVRRAICEAEIEQIVGRVRGVNRTAADPVDVFVMADTPLSVPVDELIAVEELDPTPTMLMLAAKGFATSNSTDAHRVFPDLFPSANAAKIAMQERPRQTGSFSNKESYLGNDPVCSEWTYQKAGERMRPAKALVDPVWHPDPTAALDALVGPLVWCRKVEPAALAVTDGEDTVDAVGVVIALHGAAFAAADDDDVLAGSGVISAFRPLQFGDAFGQPFQSVMVGTG